MTRDDIIRMAREAGFVVDEKSQQHQPNCIFHTWHMIDEVLARFAALVATAEREACAKEIRGYFAAARFDNRTLGLGDVRVTVRDVDDLAQSICKNPLQVGAVKECLTVEAAVKAEREACAKVCEETTAAWTQHLYNEGCMDCAKAIRARGQA